MTQQECDKLLNEIRLNRQMQKKRLYEQAKRANAKQKESK